ncbi:hypothetical protein BMF94_0777 [Rhodotorula taiwanensis]|uniref:Carbonic anhydrase n=1 Tax=Rhodotorula taiwanensis TaxID=741276 RepID=A0A2S5BH24_9BASI|nr:hypothetical protein BMF94_0777 [Rhodotorula taiwanensis]
MASHLASLVSTATAKATDQPVTKGSSFADVELAENNANYVKTFDALVGDKGRKHLMPKRGIAIICCMDARLDPVNMCGLEVGDAHIIRNGGGRAADAMRSLIGSQEALQTREIVVIHHEDCGYSHASTPVIQKALKSRTPDGAHPLVDAISLQEFSDPKESVREDVAFLRTNPLVHPESMISGWYYSVQNGELTRVI